MTKRLYRSKSNKIIAGVCGGVGEYSNVDPVVIRLIYLLLTIFTGVVPGIVAYILAILIVPEEPWSVKSETIVEPEKGANEPSEI